MGVESEGLTVMIAPGAVVVMVIAGMETRGQEQLVVVLSVMLVMELVVPYVGVRMPAVVGVVLRHEHALERRDGLHCVGM